MSESPSTRATPAEAPPAWFTRAVEAPRESRQIEVAGCPIHYLFWGEADRPGIVLVHGGAAHAHWWVPFAPHLTSEYSVAAIDLSGHGDYGRRPVYDPSTWGDEIMAVAADAGFRGKPILVAHSMGGFITMHAAVRYGDQLAGAVILDSPITRPEPEVEEAAYGRSFGKPRYYPDEKTALEHYRLVPDQPWVHPFIMDYVARHSLRRFDEGYGWKFDAQVFNHVVLRGAVREWLPQVGCRVALFRGENGLVTPDIGEYMFELMHRNAPVVEIPLAYHHMMLDQPLSTLAALRALLADWEHSVPRRSSA